MVAAEPRTQRHVQAVNDDLQRRILIKDAVVVTGDPRIGNFARADILVEGRRIAAVGVDLAEANGDAFVIDGRGKIAIPGFVDAHRHCWQNSLRRLMPDCDDMVAYLQVAHYWLAKYYEAEDIYLGNLVTALGCLDAGITTVLDVFHNARSADHSDGAIGAFLDAGIRGVHAQMPPASGPWDGQWPEDLLRVRDTYCSSDDSLITMRSGLVGAEFATDQSRLSADSIREARDLGIGVACDGVIGDYASRTIVELGRSGLLDEDLLFIHCLDLSAEAWRHLSDGGAKVALAVTSDSQLGISASVSPMQQCLDVGITPGLSVDVEISLTGDMFTQMRAAMLLQRVFAFRKRFDREPFEAPLGMADVLGWATSGGAAAVGLEHKVGSLTPGKEADIVLISADDVNVMPLNNVYGTIVSAADTSNVETVLVAGAIRKYANTLVGVDLPAVRSRVEASRDAVLSRAGYPLDIFQQSFGYGDQVAGFPAKEEPDPSGFRLPGQQDAMRETGTAVAHTAG